MSNCIQQLKDCFDILRGQSNLELIETQVKEYLPNFDINLSVIDYSFDSDNQLITCVHINGYEFIFNEEFQLITRFEKTSLPI